VTTYTKNQIKGWGWTILALIAFGIFGKQWVDHIGPWLYK